MVRTALVALLLLTVACGSDDGGGGSPGTTGGTGGGVSVGGSGGSGGSTAGGGGTPASGGSAGTPPNPAVVAALDQFITDKMAEAHLPGVSVAVVRDGAVLWTGAYGDADLAAKKPVDGKTLF